MEQIINHPKQYLNCEKIWTVHVIAVSEQMEKQVLIYGH